MGLHARLNPRQLEAVEHGDSPLLIVAGAGTGKTTTLAHRVALQIAGGVPPQRMLVVTFARRAAAELVRAVDGILRERKLPSVRELWGGTFHSVGARLLRAHGESMGLEPGFSILDRADSIDLLDVVRAEVGLSTNDKRFPRKATCMEIYSRCVSARLPVEELLASHYPWCLQHAGDLKRLFAAYCDRKADNAILDYDDLLLYWHGLLADPVAGELVRGRFDRVLVDEYQDTNALQAELLASLCPSGRGLTVVGDDAQSIYSFRGATVRNILDFPRSFAGTTVVTLEENYRSLPTLVKATNAVIAHSAERHHKELFSQRRALAGSDLPSLVTCRDEDEQTDFVVRRVLEHREQGIPLRSQAVLFRAAHHSLALELELGRRKIPFHKYGGLRFVEAAHVKDLVSFLRLADNPRDVVAGTRVLTLLPGVGPAHARRMLDETGRDRSASFAGWHSLEPPTAAAEVWPQLVALLESLVSAAGELPSQVHRVRDFYQPLLEDKYDDAAPRLRDLDQLEQLAARYDNRGSFLSELALDPPASTQDLAGPPVLDEDWLVLSTIHSAKGLEWDAVYVIHAADGNIPSDLATGRADEIEEERRLFYVALSRARDWLYVTFPLRYYHKPSAVGGHSDAHSYAQLTRFLPPEVRASFRELTASPPRQSGSDGKTAAASPGATATIRANLRAMWR